MQMYITLKENPTTSRRICKYVCMQLLILVIYPVCFTSRTRRADIVHAGRRAHNLLPQYVNATIFNVRNLHLLEQEDMPMLRKIVTEELLIGRIL